jgi:BirA family biotin operon repressor/biotin-[acetyl-CoA-carboxylase] ligase
MNTLFVGQNMIELDQVDSTNTYAIHLIKELNIADGSVVFTQNQTNGRGQLGNTWQAERGKNLTFSLVLHPGFLAVTKQFYLSKITSLAVFGMLTDFLNTSRYDIKIKWPNDILVNNEKIGGILIENILRSTFLQSSVIGLGININQQDFSGIEKKVTSLAVLLKKDFGIKEILSLFCAYFEAYYLMLKQGHFDRITQLYLSRLYRFNELASFSVNGKIIHSTITHVEENGLLVLTNSQNEVSKFNFKEIVFSS